MSALAVVWLLSLTANASANWNQPVAASLNFDPAQPVYYPHMASVGGVPYVAWEEQFSGTRTRVYVARLGGSAWQAVGNPILLSANGDAQDPTIASIGGVPYVAWAEYAGPGMGNLIHVARFDGSAWQPVGGAVYSNSAANAVEPSIASIGGVPWVAWTEGSATSPYTVHVAAFNGVTWNLVGGPIYLDATQPGVSPSLTSVGGVPYVTWAASNGANTEVQVKEFDGTNWQTVGNALNVDPSQPTGPPSITSIGAVPYVVWTEYDAATKKNHVYVKRFDGTAWQPVGGTLNIDPNQSAYATSITTIAGGPFVAWEERYAGTNRDRVHVKRFDGSSWQTVGSDLIVNPTAGDAYEPSITSIGGVPYVTFGENPGTVGQVRVERLGPDFLAESATPTATGATLTTKINDFGVAMPIGFEFGTTPAFGFQTLLQTSPGTGISTVTQKLRGLFSSTQYDWRAFGSDMFRQTSVSPTQSFVTLAAAGAGPTPGAGPAPGAIGGAPVVTGLSVSPRSFAATRGRGATIARVRRTGAIVRYTDSEAAKTTFTVLRPQPGIVRGGRCVAAGRRNRRQRGRRCTRYLALGSFARQDRKGRNSFHFTGRVAGRALSPGAYLLQAVPHAAGKTGTGASVGFSIIR